MRHLESVTLPAREDERMLEAEEDDSLSDDLDDFEIWLSIINEQDAELVRFLSDDALAITFHGYDNFVQIIWPEILGKAIAGDKKLVKLMEDAARILDEDAEVHHTWQAPKIF